MERSYTLISILLSMLAGIMVADNMILSDAQTSVLLSCSIVIVLINLILVLIITPDKEVFAGIITLAGGFMLGCCIQASDNNKFHNFMQYPRTSTTLHVIDKPIIGEKSIKLTCSILSSRRKYPNVLLYMSKSAIIVPKIGDIVVIGKKLEEIKNFANDDNFDYRRYCYHNGIGYSVFANDDIEAIYRPRRTTNVKIFLRQCQEKLLQILHKDCEDERLFVTGSALLLGNSVRDEEIRQTFSTAGTIHVLCVSGLHVTTIFLLISWLLNRIRNKRFRHYISPVLAIMCIWFYAGITGLSNSVVRAAIMLTLYTIGKIFDRKVGVMNILLGSAIITMIINPDVVYSVGAQMSYAAVGSIALFQNHFAKYYKSFFEKRKTFIFKILHKIIDIISISLSVQMLVGPIIVYYFHTFSTYFLLANIVAIPLATIILYCGILYMALSMVPVIGEIIGKLFYLLVKTLMFFNELINKIPYASHDVISVDIIVLFMIFVIVTLFHKSVKEKLGVKDIKWFLFITIMISLYNMLKIIHKI